MSRIAIMNRVKLNSICWLISGRRSHLLGTDADWDINADALSRIEDITGYPRATISSMLLHAYQEKLIGYQLGGGLRRWILPVKAEGQRWTGHGQQFCPSCLQEGLPYYRRSWRLAFVVCCPMHRVLLHDSCPSCGTSISFFRNLHHITNLNYVSHLARCSNCLFDLRHSRRPLEYRLSTALVSFSSSLLTVLTNGWLTHLGSVLYSNLYFDGLHRIATVMLSSRRGHRLLSSVLAEIDGSLFNGEHTIRGRLETLRVLDRALVIKALAWLMEKWPENFVSAISHAKLRRDDFVDFHAPTPFWLASVCQERLGAGRRIRSLEERKSAELFLRNHGLSASVNNVNRWLGGWHVLRNKSSRQSVLEIAMEIRRKSLGGESK